ncbi:hypothetical protein RclHR1_05300013 [Rhizophagus clarus]|uniref:Uncharacterized protein n=1 Tax=Rhizophagus clarus TaxID=94130 RepID=A0A2Z6S511_9GLOM|nr:hypothetical protein RclHR1_05300013 [Rhizophagus clarus]
MRDRKIQSINEIKGGKFFFSCTFIYFPIIPNIYLFLCFSSLLLIIIPAQKTHSRYRRATHCWASNFDQIRVNYPDLI